MKSSARIHRLARGFSIVELMVAMTLSLVLLGGILSVLYSSKVTYESNERVARLQENARATVELMLRDFRSGGFEGCARPLRAEDFENMLASSTSLMRNYAQPAQGYEGSSGVFAPAVDAAVVSPLPGSDIIVVRGVQTGATTYRLSTSMADGTSNIILDKPGSEAIPTNRPWLISNCERSTVIAIESATDTGVDEATLTHGTLGTLANSGPNIGAFPIGSQLSPLTTVVYYVRQDDPADPPALWRIRDGDAPELLVQGVERIEAVYGEDTSGDFLADTYVTADAVTDWTAVTSVSVSVLLRAVEGLGQARQSRDFDMLGTVVGPFNDRFERTLFTTTAALRNQAP